MYIEIPDFSDSHVQSFSACGLLADEDDNSSKGETVIEAKIEQNESIWCRLIVGQQSDPDGIHLHFDTCRESYFDPDRIPKSDSKFDDIINLISPYKGLSISGTARSAFMLPLSGIPDNGIMSLLSNISAETKDNSMQLTGGNFSVEKGPLRSIRWRLDTKEHLHFFVLSEFFEIAVGSKYLLEIFEPAKKAFQTFIFEDE